MYISTNISYRAEIERRPQRNSPLDVRERPEGPVVEIVLAARRLRSVGHRRGELEDSQVAKLDALAEATREQRVQAVRKLRVAVFPRPGQVEHLVLRRRKRQHQIRNTHSQLAAGRPSEGARKPRRAP